MVKSVERQIGIAADITTTYRKVNRETNQKIPHYHICYSSVLQCSKFVYSESVLDDLPSLLQERLLHAVVCLFIVVLLAAIIAGIVVLVEL